VADDLRCRVAVMVVALIHECCVSYALCHRGRVRSWVTYQTVSGGLCGAAGGMCVCIIAVVGV
jgi:hypothetical protein